ncbi:protein snakeskin [Dendroctonus ponderosae]|uniref:MARVEL domain-containing protein n=1 Tax=Dendroctonus ponderosae TaxID=77166 RepID=J3JYN4_DENPD|nr:protein snakeskin [Dendroctonus ponderosae]AEE63321.1 unknown [Dendroctonus ponderosae]
MALETIASIIVKLVKLVLNFIILVLYRVGFAGDFLGVGGTWNLFEEKSSDVEIIASGVFVGYFVYTAVSLISLCLASSENKNTFTDILMNIVGVFLWIAVGATALHYWHGYLSEHKYTYVNSERQVGLALGSLSVLNGAVYLVDSVISVIFLIKAKLQ